MINVREINKQVKTASEEAQKYGVVLDSGKNGAKTIESFIRSVESAARIALDLDGSANVSDDVFGLIDTPALAAFYGQLFVDNAQAEWQERDGDSGPAPAVVRGKVVLFPSEEINRRINDGPRVDLQYIFKSESSAMLKQKL